jgi:soluble lytic murein transglycosylase-like protein
MANADSVFSPAAKQAKVDVNLLRAVCWVESGHRSIITREDGGSSSIGICQLKLATAKHMGFKGTRLQLLDPKVNARYAAKYLAWQFKRYGDWKFAIIAYNRGHFKQKMLKNNSYVKRVMLALKEKR